MVTSKVFAVIQRLTEDVGYEPVKQSVKAFGKALGYPLADALPRPCGANYCSHLARSGMRGNDGGLLYTCQCANNSRRTDMAPRAKRDTQHDDRAEVGSQGDPAKELLWARPGFLVRRLHQIHVAMFFEECKTANITPVQYAILTVLSVMSGLDQTSLGQEVGLDRTTTADVVRRLEERGLLERRDNPADRRTRHVFLSKEGKSLVTSLRNDMARAQERMLAPLTPTQRKTFMNLLATLVEANNQYSRTVLRAV